jgi:hypothetical protein
MQAGDGSDGTQQEAEVCEPRAGDPRRDREASPFEDDQRRYIHLHDGGPLPVSQEEDPMVRARILRGMSRVDLTDEEISELDARLRDTPMVLRTFRTALSREIARIVAARKSPAQNDRP